MYGGAAGGGKSDALLMAALQYADVFGYAAVIFRRTFPQLSAPDSLIPRSQEWLGGTDATWSQQDRQWTFPSGAVLKFSHLENEKDKYSHQSAAYQFVGFDELTQFTETQYLYLFSRLRKLEKSEIPLRMRAASNPGGEGHDWVKQRFITNLVGDRAFIPATLSENPHLNQTEYTKSLMLLDPFTRKQLLAGDWDAAPMGGMFKREWFPMVEAIPAEAKRVRWWDKAATQGGGDYTAGVLVAEHEKIYYIEDVVRGQWSSGERDKVILQTAQLDSVKYHNLVIWSEQEPGSSGKDSAASFVRLLTGFTARTMPSTGDKIVRASPFASQAEAGNVKLLNKKFAVDFLNEMCEFPFGSHDDQVDAASSAFARLAASYQGKMVIMGWGK